MKKITSTLFTVFLFYSALAEYGGYTITMTIVSIYGKKNIGYAHVPADYLHPDSLKNTGYLLKWLGQPWKDPDKRDSLVYFETRISYEYKNIGDNSEQIDRVYYLNNRKEMAFQSIKSITVDEKIDYSYMINISNELKASDTIWMRKKPLKSLAFDSHLCYYQLYVHAYSRRTKYILKQLEIKQKEKNNAQTNSNNSVIINGKIEELIKKLTGQKVVVVALCSC